MSFIAHLDLLTDSHPGTLCFSPTDTTPTEGENLLTREATTGLYVLRLTAHKVSRRTGYQEIPLPTGDLTDTVKAITAPRLRRELLCGQKPHATLFVNKAGLPISSSGEWAKLLQSVFHHGFELAELPPAKISVNSLRHSFVTSVHSTDTSLQERESVAAAMRHQPATAAKNYHAASARDRVQAGVQLSARLYEESKMSSTRAVHVALVEVGDDEDDEDGEDDEDEETVGGGLGGQLETESETESEAESEAKSVWGTVERLLEFRMRPAPAYKVRWAGTLGDKDEDTWLDEEEVPRSCIREFWQQAAVASGRKPVQRPAKCSQQKRGPAAALSPSTKKPKGSS